MTAPRRRRLVLVLAAAAVVVVTGAGILAWQVLGGSEPPAAALSSPSATETEGSSASAGGGRFGGTWGVDTTSGSLEDGSSTYAGYRIDEEVSGIGANTAVGRTQDVSGTMTIEGTTVTALDLSVDMTTLRSDDDRRDGQLDERGLQTASFPTATFSLTQPIDIGDPPAVDEPIETTITGDLTLHGVTKQVEVPVQAQWTGERFEVVASLDVALADYGIEPPTGFLVLSIADTGTIELHVLFTQS